MNLHEDQELFRDAIIATSQQKMIREIYVEKDYWVTYILSHIYNNEIGKEVVFKGGTALSKCFNIIERFSEDIDLIILKNKDETGNQLKNKLKKISKHISKVLPETDIEGITHKVGVIRKTAHSYPHIFDGEFGQVRDIIIVEATCLGNSEPYINVKINSFIYEMLSNNKQQDIIDKYNMMPFEILTLSPKRTLCEKIMSLVRFSQTEDAINDLKNKIRHIYDIHLILKNNNLNNFFFSNEFENMLVQVANDDIMSFKNNNNWLSNHPSSAIIFSDRTNIWKKIRSTYTGSFSELVFGELPLETDIFRTLETIALRLNSIEWTIKI